MNLHPMWVRFVIGALYVILLNNCEFLADGYRERYVFTLEGKLIFTHICYSFIPISVKSMQKVFTKYFGSKIRALKATF
jgi:hypothetical protein